MRQQWWEPWAEGGRRPAQREEVEVDEAWAGNVRTHRGRSRLSRTTAGMRSQSRDPKASIRYWDDPANAAVATVTRTCDLNGDKADPDR
jgi:hypothetical protein